MFDSILNFFAPPRDIMLLVVMVWVGSYVTEKGAERFGLPQKTFGDFISNSLTGFLIAGGFKTISLNFSATTLLRVIQIDPGLFDAWLGMIAILLTAVYYFQRAKLPFWQTLDALTPLLAFTAIGIALTHLASGQAFGMETNVAWAIRQWGALRHPTQLYELLASLLILGWLLLPKPDSPSGILFLHFTALTAGARLFLEAFRGDSILVLGEFRLAQIVAWVVLAVALFTNNLIRQQKNSPV
jgi:phosphatidylglycerol:prolipoprotein diacylglycerol transferase